MTGVQTCALPISAEVRERFQVRQWGGLQFGWFAQIMGNYVGFVAGGMMIGWVWVSRKRFTARR